MHLIRRKILKGVPSYCEVLISNDNKLYEGEEAFTGYLFNDNNKPDFLTDMKEVEEAKKEYGKKHFSFCFLITTNKQLK